MRARWLLLVAAAGLVLATGAAALLPRSGNAPLSEPRESLGPRPLEPVRFLAWGDGGHGSPEQRDTAEGARTVCARDGCDLALGLGDNIYDRGVSSPQDEQFVTKFESPYAELDVPFYMVLGNHDVGGNASAQVAYTNRSDKWNMPARSYWFVQGSVLFVGLDLTALEAGDASDADKLGAWVEQQLARPASWRVVFAHFPYASNGQHGNGSKELRAFLEAHVCGKADLYLAGHDHDMQWLGEQPRCGGTELVVSGAASTARPLEGKGAASRFGVGETRGFFWFEARRDTLVGRAYDADGRLLYERTLVKEARAGAASTPRPPASAP